MNLGTARLVGLVLSALLCVVACGGVSPQNAVRERGAVTSAADSPVEVPVQTCEHRATGEGGATGIGDRTPDPSWRARSLVVGPVGFLNFDGFANLSGDPFDPAKPGSVAHGGIILPVIVEAGASVTIGIPVEARGSVLLLDSARTAPLRGSHPSLADGITTIRLEACQAMDTDFRPALIPTKPQCVPLDVSTSQVAAPTRVVLPLGTTMCPDAGVLVSPRLTG